MHICSFGARGLLSQGFVQKPIEHEIRPDRNPRLKMSSDLLPYKHCVAHCVALLHVSHGFVVLACPADSPTSAELSRVVSRLGLP